MTYNIPLMEKVRDLIHRYPDQHEQSWFSSENDRLPTEHCGTSACIAGWTATALGHTVNEVEEGMGRDMSTWAAEQLGISGWEARVLFFTFNNARALQELEALIEKAKA